MLPDKDREALINDALAQLRKKLEQELPGDNATLDDIEEAVTRIGDALQQELQQKLLNRRSRKPRPNQSACPTCRRAVPCKGKAERRLVSAHGLVRLVRSYYYCAFCKRGHAPLDAELGLDRGSTTKKVRRWAAELAAKEAFEEAAQTLFHLTGVSLSAATLERITLGVGDGLAQAQQSQVQQYQQERLPEPKGRRPQRLYIGMDGLMVPLREAWKKDASQGSLSCRFGECKTGVVYEAYAGKHGDERVRSHAYCATLADVHNFGPLLATLARSQGYGFARERVVLGDGAPWIWQLAGKHFPQALQIVDFYHACQHLATVADARFGVGTEASRSWQRARQAELRVDGVRAVLGAIAGWKPKTQQMRHLRRREFGYFRSNAERMRYGTFLSRGYHIGSGVVEAACKHVVALRLDQAGMHWRQETAEAVVRVRAALRSTYPPDLSLYCAMPA